MEDFQSKYSGEQVEEMLDQIANGEIGGGGGVTAETDPIFSASPAASITEEKKTEWDNKVDKVSGKQLSTEDFTTALKTKLDGLSNYDDTELSEALSTLRGDFDELVSGDTTTAIKTFNEIIAFLDGIQDSQDLSSIIASIEQQIAGKMDKVTLATVATSGSYNDLSNKPTIPTTVSQLDNDAEYITHEDVAAVARTGSYNDLEDKPTIPVAVTESTVSGWGFTKNTGTLTGVAINGTAINANNGVVYIPNASTGSYGTTKLNPSTDSTSILEAATPSAVKAAYDLANSKQDKLESGTNIKTINGQSIVGSGNLIIEGGSGGVSQENFDNLASFVDDLNEDISQLTANAVSVQIQGDLRFADYTDGMISSGRVIYALPDSVSENSTEDDIIATANTLKTINGQSLVGSGDIEISGGSGGGEDIRFFTDFTVEDFIKACEIANVVTYDTTELFNAMKSNKVICVPYRGFDKGFIVASYRSGENEEYPSMYIQKGDVEYYAWTGDDHALVGDYPIYNSVQVVEMAGGEEVVLECLSNHIYRITDPVDFLMPIPNYVVKGATIQFISGNSGTTLELYEALWANGEIPQIEPNTHYELSLMINSTYEYNAVLTPFKLVE